MWYVDESSVGEGGEGLHSAALYGEVKRSQSGDNDHRSNDAGEGLIEGGHIDVAAAVMKRDASGEGVASAGIGRILGDDDGRSHGAQVCVVS